jgi:REP element-mobilizing transposase RayT
MLLISRMSRPLRIQFPEAVYHVMNRGARRQSIFIDDTDYQAFFEIFSEANRLWGIEVFAYALMGNHYHLCLRTPKGNLSRVMRHVDGIYTQRFNRRHGRDGTLFRGRYKAILIEADEYLGGCGSLHSSERDRGGNRKNAGGLSLGKPPVLSVENSTKLAQYGRSRGTDRRETGLS